MPVAPITHRLHRNSQKRIYEEGASYFITTITFDRYPHFQTPVLADLFIYDLMYAKKLKRFVLHGYAVLPEHVHLLITPSANANYSEIMRSLKTNYARDANDIMFGRKKIVSDAGDVAPRRLLDHEYHRRFLAENGLNNSIPFFKWQKSFRDHIIGNGNDFNKHLDYIYNNALKHGLAREPEEWKWMWVERMGDCQK